ncbi:MAG TPA: hypothetical protein VFP84_03180, partial [Kofleriaceae bacterium]|nr:hypothetical protein [Kofleriaceae bacterium]
MVKIRYSVMGALTIIASVACQQDNPAPPAKATAVARPAVVAPDLTPIVAQAGPLEFPDGDGEPFGMPLKEFQTRAAAFRKKHVQSSFIVADHVPPGLSPTARAGFDLPRGRTAVSWVVDGDARHGYTLIYDENANGDLRDDPRHAFTADHDHFDTFIDTTVTTREPARTSPFRIRLRVRGDQVYANFAVFRRGTIAVGGHARPFILSWNATGFDNPSARIALDLDGDGKTQLSSWTEESPESF